MEDKAPGKGLYIQGTLESRESKEATCPGWNALKGACSPYYLHISLKTKYSTTSWPLFLQNGTAWAEAVQSKWSSHHLMLDTLQWKSLCRSLVLTPHYLQIMSTSIEFRGPDVTLTFCHQLGQHICNRLDTVPKHALNESQCPLKCHNSTFTSDPWFASAWEYWLWTQRCFKSSAHTLPSQTLLP